MLQAQNDRIGFVDQETYGVDWEALREPSVIRSHLNNNPITEESSAWLNAAEAPPAERLNSVVVNAPEQTALSEVESEALLHAVQPFLNTHTDEGRTQCWITALVLARSLSALF